MCLLLAGNAGLLAVGPRGAAAVPSAGGYPSPAGGRGEPPLLRHVPRLPVPALRPAPRVQGLAESLMHNTTRVRAQNPHAVRVQSPARVLRIGA